MKFKWIIALQIINPPNFFQKFFFHPWNELKVKKITKFFCRCCCCYKMACNRFTQWYAKKGYPAGMHLSEKLEATRETKVISLIGEPLLICKPWHFDPKQHLNLSFYLYHFTFLFLFPKLYWNPKNVSFSFSEFDVQFFLFYLFEEMVFFSKAFNFINVCLFSLKCLTENGVYTYYRWGVTTVTLILIATWMREIDARNN